MKKHNNNSSLLDILYYFKLTDCKNSNLQTALHSSDDERFDLSVCPEVWSPTKVGVDFYLAK